MILKTYNQDEFTKAIYNSKKFDIILFDETGIDSRNDKSKYALQLVEMFEKLHNPKRK